MTIARMLLLLTALMSGIAGAATAQVLSLTGPIARETVFDGHVAGLRDPGRNLELEHVRTPQMQARFKPIEGRAADFGYTEDALWLRLGLRNATEATRDWRMVLRSNFLPEFKVWLVGEGGEVRVLEDQRPDSTFGARALPYPELTVPFELLPGAGATIFVRYSSGGSSNVSFSIQTAESFAAIASRKTARNFVFYGMMLLLTGAAFVSCLLTRRMIFAAYGAYAASALLFVMHADGNTFQYLWPGWPAFNAFASVLLGAGLIVFGANFARMFLRTGRLHPVVNALLIGLIVVAFLMVAATAFADTRTIKKLLVLTAFGSTILFLVAGLVAARTRFREVRFYVLAWLGAVLASAIMTGRHWLGLEISEELQFDAMRVVMVTDAVMMGLAILDSVNQMKQARQKALETALAEAERNLELSERLRQLEEGYEMAMALAQTNERRLADTAHDLRQPINALRLNIQRLLRGGGAGEPPPRREDFEESFDYLERLVASELERQAGRAEPAEPPPGTPVDEVLDAVAEMFAPSAEAAGIALHHVKSRAHTGLPPLVLMRIASNLVSNAIKYGGGGRVVMGVRRRDGVPWLEVHDGGAGLSQADFDRARERTVRLGESDAEGAGLGLAIVAELADAHGLAFMLCPGRRSGTGIAVSLPQPGPAENQVIT